MAWTLKPRSYYQAMRPNLYDLAYRRTGAYKGMGWLGQSCPGDPSCPGYVDPYQNLSTLTEGVLSGQNVLVSTSAYNQLLNASATQPASTTPSWVLYGLAAALVLGMIGAGRR